MAFNCSEQTVGRERAGLLGPPGLPGGELVSTASVSFVFQRKPSADLSEGVVDVGADQALLPRRHGPAQAPRGLLPTSQPLGRHGPCHSTPAPSPQGGGRACLLVPGRAAGASGEADTGHTTDQLDSAVRRPQTPHEGSADPTAAGGSCLWTRSPLAAPGLTAHGTLAPSSRQQHRAVSLTSSTQPRGKGGRAADTPPPPPRS